MTSKFNRIFFLCWIFSGAIFAQVYQESKSQHRFAQSYVGFNTQFIPAQGGAILGLQPTSIPASISPRLTLGGLHFFGKLDFNMNLAFGTFMAEQPENQDQIYFRNGGDLSARYYPWRMEFGKLRPYVGASFNVMGLNLDRPLLGNRSDAFVNMSLIGGFSFGLKNWQLNAEMMFLPQTKQNFYVNRSENYDFELPQTYFSMSLVRYFDFTMREEKPMKSGKTAELETKLKAEKKLNSFSIGVGLSSAFFLQSPEYQSNMRFSVPKHRGVIYWDLGVGYLFTQAKFHLGISYRDYTSGTESFGLEHLIRRRAIALEGYKFFWNYKGFVPFLGVSVSRENWATAEFEGNVQTLDTEHTRKIDTGIIFGWDILPSPLETWVLRTNLRYYPFQKITNLEGNSSRIDQFEFNFIQLVIYPNRMFNIGKAKRKMGFYKS